jgi:hypothetical protein
MSTNMITVPVIQKAYKHLIIVELDPHSDDPELRIFNVFSKYKKQRLGTISFYHEWSCFNFLPEAFTEFSPDCLRDIANFCEKHAGSA